jgi:hypothetical protein
MIVRMGLSEGVGVGVGVSVSEGVGVGVSEGVGVSQGIRKLAENTLNGEGIRIILVIANDAALIRKGL